MVLTSQEKWDRLKSICAHWLAVVRRGKIELDYKRLLSDRGFLVYVTQAYPSMKPYLKGFHLSLETWRGGRNHKGWKAPPRPQVYVEETNPPITSMEEVKNALMTDSSTGRAGSSGGPPGGFTLAVPRFKEDLEALTLLTEGEHSTRFAWSVDTHACQEWKGVRVAAPPNNSRRCFGRVPQVRPHANRCLPCFLDPKALLSPLAAHVLQSF
jgi:hypothetical protein